MMKLNRMKLLVAVSAGILVSSIASADYTDPTISKIKDLSKQAGQSALSASRSTAPADSMQEALGQLEDSLLAKGATLQFDKEREEKAVKAKRWSDGISTLGKVDEAFTALEQKRAKDRRSALSQGNGNVKKTLSQLGSALNEQFFGTPPDTAKSCTKDVNMGTLKQEAQNLSGVLKGVGGDFVKVMTAESKKAEKAAKQELEKSLAEQEKKILAQEDPEADALASKDLPEDLSDFERAKILKKDDARIKSKKQAWSRKILEVFKTHKDGLTRFKVNKDMFGEVGGSLNKELEVVRDRMEKAGVASATAAYNNCLAVAEQAGLVNQNNPNNQNNNNNQNGLLGGLGGVAGSMIPGMPGQFGTNFAIGSSAQNALSMLTANYRGSLNFVPVVSMYQNLFFNKVNQIQCTDYTSQVQQILGTNLKNSFSALTKAQDPETLNKALKDVDSAISTAANDAGKLFNDPSNPDAGAIADCNAAADVKRQIDQFAQGQAQQVMLKNGGGQPRGGFGGGAPQQVNHFGPQQQF